VHPTVESGEVPVVEIPTMEMLKTRNKENYDLIIIDDTGT